MAALAPPVQVVASGAPPFVHVASGAPPFVAVSGNAPPITIVADGAPPITLLNEDGSIWTGGAAEVAPVLSAASAADFSDINVLAQATTDTASGTLYGVVVPSAATAPSAAQIEAGTDGSGNAATAAANRAITASGARHLLLRTVTAGTAYKVYLTHKLGASYSNVVNASFTSDVLVVAYATTGASTGLGGTGAGVYVTNVADPFGGTNAVTWKDANDAGAGVAMTMAMTAYNGVNKVHYMAKHQGGAQHQRVAVANITAITGNTHWNISTGTPGTNAWATAPVIYDIGFVSAGWYLFSGTGNLAGADVAGTFQVNMGTSNNSLTCPRDGTHFHDIFNIRITRAGP